MLQPSLFPETENAVTRAKRILKVNSVRFDGPVYVPRYDDARLSGQILRVYNVMRSGEWRTLDEIHFVTNDPHASISAQLRHLRKKKFGGHQIEKRPRGDRVHGLFEYRLLRSHEV